MKMVDDERNESNQPLLGGMNLKTSIASKEIYADVNGVFTTGFFMVAFGMVLTFPVMLSLSKNNTIIEDVSWVYSKEVTRAISASAASTCQGAHVVWSSRARCVARGQKQRARAHTMKSARETVVQNCS